MTWGWRLFLWDKRTVAAAVAYYSNHHRTNLGVLWKWRQVRGKWEPRPKLNFWRERLIMWAWAVIDYLKGPSGPGAS